MLEELVALAKIAEIDAAALQAETELSDIPARLRELEADVKKLGGLLEAERQELKEAEALLQAQDEEILGQNQSLAKSKQKGARARNMREADAVERELEVIRRVTKEREAERDALKAAIEKRQGSIEKHGKDFGGLETYFGEEKLKSETRLAELTEQREKIMQGRAALATKVPADVVRRYDMVRSRRAGTGLALIKDGGCAGCFIGLTPQQVIATRRGETFEQCPRCQRILYFPPQPPTA